MTDHFADNTCLLYATEASVQFLMVSLRIWREFMALTRSLVLLLDHPSRCIACIAGISDLCSTNSAHDDMMNPSIFCKHVET